MFWKRIGLFVIAGLIASGIASSHGDVQEAECTVDASTGVTGTDSRPLKGTIKFKQGSSGTEVTINLSGFTTGDLGTKHGFHVHRNESTADECKAADGHYNPGGALHGGKNDATRHVGDLGNVVVTEGGVVKTSYTDSVISLNGDNSIINKVIVIHAGEDDLGKGGDTESTKTGNAGARIACCQIKKVVKSASCKLDGTTGVKGDSGRPLMGTVGLIQVDGGVTVTINLSGFTTGDDGTKHGFHVHADESTDNECKAAGGHYNPGGTVHAGRDDATRHVGDLGNVVVIDGGVVETSYTDSVISLNGDNSIINKVIVIHAGEDDLGTGGDAESKKTGNAGARLACCQIKDDESSQDISDSTSPAPEGTGQPVGGGVVPLLSVFLYLSMFVHWI